MRFSFEIGRAKAAVEPTTQKKGKRMSGNVNLPNPDRVSMQMDSLRQAVENARDVNNPVYADLYNIYKNSMTDSQVRSQYDVAVNKLQASPFKITRNEADDDELTKLFERPWFSKFIQILFDAELWGYTLTEFGQIDENGEFVDCRIFPRWNVYPFNRNIIINADDTSGIPYEGKTKQFFLLEIGETSDIGLLELISREIIWKAFARRDWSELSEKWGKPHLIIKTDAEGDELTARETAARNFGNNAYIITDTDDEVDTLESKASGAGHLIFEKNIRLIDEQIAKLMNGQTGTSEEKAYVGSAEVHERVLNDYHASRLRRYGNYINYQLIPFLIHHGYPLQPGDEIRFTELDPKEGEVNNNPEDPKSDESRKAEARLRKKKLLALSPGEVLEQWLKRFFDDPNAGIDPEIWQLNFEQLLSGLNKAGIKFADSYQYAELASELRSNAATFAAFKNHDEQLNLRDLLVDEKGEPVSWSAFKKAAKPLTEQYNVNWLKTEFKQAEANAQMAVKWAGFEENADLYPNLEYRHSGNPDGRREHMRLDGLVLPINDKRWGRIYPPNGWGCACDVTQTDKPVHEPKAAKGFEPDKGFDNNTGADKKLFSDSNGYQSNVDKTTGKTITKEADKLLKQYLKEDGK
ncbi:DUF935 family protein [uncultured Draconibacterium sp.]|uniref:phage portal protein family protein n=1 Tax=uncultured Draconibacterium sp. TaxID=1573823 RepID=UPI003217BE82